MNARPVLIVAGVLALAILGYFLVHALRDGGGEAPKPEIDNAVAPEDKAPPPEPVAIPLPAREPAPPPSIPVQAPANADALPGQVGGIVYDAEGAPAAGVAVAVTSTPMDGETAAVSGGAGRHRGDEARGVRSRVGDGCVGRLLVLFAARGHMASLGAGRGIRADTFGPHSHGNS